MKKKIVSALVLLAVSFLFVGSKAYGATDRLDYGIYWLGYNGDMEKFVPGQYNRFYDASKPVVLYIHGWQKGSSQNNYAKENLFFSDAGIWSHNNWLEKGWNVGIFYWSQWADENEVKDAEAKIWSRSGPKGFRYRLSDGTYKTTLNPSGTAACGELAYNAFVAALAGNTSRNIRLVGHSLGNQMVTRLAELVYNNCVSGKINESTYRINRIALLDPAWTKDGKSYLGDSNGDGKNDWVGERCRWAIFKMLDRWTPVNGFAVEIYNTTALDLQLFGIAMDSNQPLRQRVTTVSVMPWYYNATQLAAKHNVIPEHYFWSMAFAPPVECTISWGIRITTGKTGPSASTPTSRIKEMMGSGYTWDQVEGRYTYSPDDDWFERKSF